MLTANPKVEAESIRVGIWDIILRGKLSEESQPLAQEESNFI